MLNQEPTAQPQPLSRRDDDFNTEVLTLIVVVAALAPLVEVRSTTPATECRYCDRVCPLPLTAFANPFEFPHYDSCAWMLAQRLRARLKGEIH